MAGASGELNYASLVLTSSMETVSAAGSLNLIHMLLRQSGDSERVKAFESILDKYRPVLGIELTRTDLLTETPEYDIETEIAAELVHLKQQAETKLEYISKLIEIGEADGPDLAAPPPPPAVLEPIKPLGSENSPEIPKIPQKTVLVDSILPRRSSRIGNIDLYPKRLNPIQESAQSPHKSPRKSPHRAISLPVPEELEFSPGLDESESEGSEVDTQAVTSETESESQESGPEEHVRRSGRLHTTKPDALQLDRAPNRPSKSIQKAVQKKEIQEEEEEEDVWCFCRGPSYGEMIGCDNADCEFEWFHFTCVGLTKPVPKKWMCRKCLTKKKH